MMRYFYWILLVVSCLAFPTQAMTVTPCQLVFPSAKKAAKAHHSSSDKHLVLLNPNNLHQDINPVIDDDAQVTPSHAKPAAKKIAAKQISKSSTAKPAPKTVASDKSTSKSKSLPAEKKVAKSEHPSKKLASHKQVSKSLENERTSESLVAERTSDNFLSHRTSESLIAHRSSDSARTSGTSLAHKLGHDVMDGANKVREELATGEEALVHHLARLTAYWEAEGDYYTRHGVSATGIHLHGGHCAVDPSIIPYGSVVEIPGVGQFLAVDTGSAVVSRTAAREAGHTRAERGALVIDLFFENRREGERFTALAPKYVSINWWTPNSNGRAARLARGLFADEDWNKIYSKQL